MPRPFLTARWSNLAIVSYAVPPAMLAPYMPVGPRGCNLELDLREGRAMVSLVAFEFQRCRVMGVPWPGHTEFPEMNLRFYVRTAGTGAAHRGVVFIREFVPRRLVAWAARKFYNEPYSAAAMTSRITQDTRTITAEYSVTPAVMSPPGGGGGRAGEGVRTHRVSVTGRKPIARPGPSSMEHWFKEHRWGFGMRPGRSGKPGCGIVYEVLHPTWGVYPVERAEVDVDFASLYGADWGFLSGAKPESVVLAAGSEVAVFPGREVVGVKWGERG